MRDRSRRMRGYWLLEVGLLTGMAVAIPSGSAGQNAGEAQAILEECARAAAGSDRSRMERVATRADSLANALGDVRPADALVVRARVISQCRIPLAGMMRRGSLIGESSALLERALELEPTHLVARFTLGMNHYHTPAFMGRADDGIREFERLIADHPSEGDGRDAGRDGTIARAYLYLGDLYERTRRTEDARATWRSGAGRFPEFLPLASKPTAGTRSTPDPPGSGGSGPTPNEGADQAVYDLPGIVVEAGGYSMDDPRTATRLTKMEVYTMPGGTADVLQTFQTMPGVTRVTEGSDLYVRGGDPAEAPIYVDGARLFHPGRFESLNGSTFGLLDPAVMRKAYFSSGGFSARYGNALSGIVDMETDGRPAERRWRAGANLATLGASFWQPVGRAAGVWGTSSMTHTGAMLALHGRSERYPTPPRSFQGMMGVVVEPSSRATLRVTALAESDRTALLTASHGYDGEFRSNASTRLATLSGRLVSREGDAAVRLSLGASTRYSDFAFGVLDRAREDRSLGVRLDGELSRGAFQLRAGLEGALLDASSSGRVPVTAALAPGSPWRALAAENEGAEHVGGYVEVETRVSGRLAMVSGMRADRLPGETIWLGDPRLAVAYQLDTWTFRVGGGGFSQGRWRTRYQLPDDARPAGVPRRARHWMAGVQREGELAFRAEAYHKDYGSYVTSGDGAAVVDGRVTGLDVILRWAGTDLISGWLTYSFLDGEIELEDGTRTRSEYDVTHNATGVAKVPIGASWELGLTGRYATGRPITPVIGATPRAREQTAAPVFGSTYSDRLPEYFRLDGRLTRLVPYRGGVLVAYLEGLNLLDRPNVMAYTYDADYRVRRPTRSFFGDRTLVLGVEAQF